ncbi:hypothetical protein C4D60_Mb06t12490 [Musa balbisiana]|uniref:Uncharacterized protein n=1 Tax=Musa balbisiana TaxID=52838 RepID=A0A4S8IMG7_MUSBA|nr:hypothetical protein C4D60_Mb06t12490 [Musa balbisiana]
MGDRGVVGVADDMGEGMQCMDHPYRSNLGGVCAFCLQEKLGKLVVSKSSPFSLLRPPPSSSSSPTSFRSDAGAAVGGIGFASGHSCTGTGAAAGARRTKVPFLVASHKQKSGGYDNGGRKAMSSVAIAAGTTVGSTSVANDSGIVLKRSKSVAPRAAGLALQDAAAGGGRRMADAAVADSPRKKSFWSFLNLSSASSTSTTSSSATTNGSSSININRRRSTSSSSVGGCDRNVKKQQRQASATEKSVGKEEAETAALKQPENSGQEAESPSGRQASSSFGRNVARSRSVGCGSRSFSGDFLERISTGFGDCTLRRVESQREAKPKIVLHLGHDYHDGEQQRPRMKERVKCGGLFGLMSAYWLSAAAADDDFDSSSRISAVASATTAARGRTRSWGLSFASPMRAFRPHSTSSKSLYAIDNAASAAPSTNIISINASTKMVNGGGIKGNKLSGNPSFLAVEI